MNLIDAQKVLSTKTYSEVNKDPDLSLLLLRFVHQFYKVTPVLGCDCLEGYLNQIKSLTKIQIDMELEKTVRLKQGFNIYFKNSHFSAATITEVIANEYLNETGDEYPFERLPDAYVNAKKAAEKKANKKTDKTVESAPESEPIQVTE
jgi:hypothetical protein